MSTLCAISGEAPKEPVASSKSGYVFEKRLIEAHIAENHTDPVTGEELSANDLLELKSQPIVQPRPPKLTSIPALLAAFQTEWDALVLESFTLKQQLAQTRQELSTALYQNDAATRVIARLTKERDEARQALSSVTVSGGAAVGTGDSGAMDVDGQALPEDLIEKIDETHQQYVTVRSPIFAFLTRLGYTLPAASAPSQTAGLPLRTYLQWMSQTRWSPFTLEAPRFP
jgi:pre-mRNA-processing factor 19